jgi:hypothetical protein
MSEMPKFTAIPRGRLVSKALEQEGRATASMLMKITGKSIVTVRDAIKKLYAQSKIHVGGYEMNSRGKLSKVWYWGDGDDVREPIIAKDRPFFTPRPDEAAAWLRNPI